MRETHYDKYIFVSFGFPASDNPRDKSPDQDYFYRSRAKHSTPGGIFTAVQINSQQGQFTGNGFTPSPQDAVLLQQALAGITPNSKIAINAHGTDEGEDNKSFFADDDLAERNISVASMAALIGGNIPQTTRRLFTVDNPLNITLKCCYTGIYLKREAEPDRAKSMFKSVAASLQRLLLEKYNLITEIHARTRQVVCSADGSGTRYALSLYGSQDLYEVEGLGSQTHQMMKGAGQQKAYGSRICYSYVKNANGALSQRYSSPKTGKPYECALEFYKQEQNAKLLEVFLGRLKHSPGVASDSSA
jgi:hypothetical protein